MEGGFTDWLLVSAGERHSCGVRQNGVAYCWGDGSHGELGTDDTNAYAVPTEVATTERFRSIAAARSFTCGISEGFLFCWGDNSSRQLGIDGISLADQPTQVGTTMGWTGIATLFHGACGILMGRVHWWGGGAEGEIGNGAWADEAEPTPVVRRRLEGGGRGHTVRLRAARGGARRAVVLGRRHLYTWGRGAEGQIGNAGTAMQLSPVDLGVNGWSDVTAAFNGNHACAISNGTVGCWGNNSSGKLGNGNTVEQSVPTAIVDHPTLPQAYSTVRAGSTHTCATHSDGLYCWGDGTLHQLGDETLTPYTDDPRLITVTELQFLTTGKGHSCGLTSASSPLYCWGDNVHGVIDDGTEAKASPVPVLPPPADR